MGEKYAVALSEELNGRSDTRLRTTHGRKVESEEFLIEAGQCFMYLLWSETVMRDFVALKEGGDDMCRRYSQAFGKTPHPRDFSRLRLELGKLDFSVIKERYLGHWSKWKNSREIRDAIERVVLWHNGLGHANVQPFRGSLLYTPKAGGGLGKESTITSDAISATNTTRTASVSMRTLQNRTPS